MRRADGDLVDEVIQAVLDHSWREHMPTLTFGQWSELLPVVSQVVDRQRRLPSVPKEYRKPKPRKPAGTVTSSRVPKRIRDAVLARDGFCCQRCGVGLRVSEGDYSLQHRDARGMGGSKRKHTLANLVALCGSATTGCHGYVESQPNESDAFGWSVPNGEVPEEWPVLRYGTSWEQPGDGWVKTLPHARQVEMGAAA